MANLLSLTKEFVDKSFGKKKPHFERTIHWLEIISTNVTDPMRMAAYSHDIERAFRSSDSNLGYDEFKSEETLKSHQQKGARIMKNFLEKHGVSQDIINEVTSLISKHEIGGNEKQDALMEADSISFLENNAIRHVRDKSPQEGKKLVREKLNWMLTRIKSPKKQLGKV
jgi:hypothetical protein